MIRRPLALLLASSLVAAGACTRPSRWSASDKPDRDDARVALEAANISELYRDPAPTEVADVPMRSRLRPCCAFGKDVQASAGRLPVPAYRIGNIRGPDDLGRHTFDSGVVHFRYSDQQRPLLNNENDGQVYTCRGGFIDSAHVRDYADWAAVLGSRLARHLEEGARFDLPPEGGARTVVLRPVDAALIERYGRIRCAGHLAQWIAFQLSIWHEIATWFWWSSVPGFPEKASAFSPEDLYSNLLGIKLAMAIAYRRSARSESVFNRSLTTWLQQVLAYLGAVPQEVGREALDAVDGLWWDSSKRLPDPALVKRRHMDVGSPVVPWLVPRDRMPDSLREACGDAPEPVPLRYRAKAEGVRFRDYVTLEIEVDDSLAAQSPFSHMGRQITERDFPAIIEVIRTQNVQEFGEGADRPE